MSFKKNNYLNKFLRFILLYDKEKLELLLKYILENKNSIKIKEFGQIIQNDGIIKREVPVLIEAIKSKN